jgi:hypothetical protein
MNFPGNLIRSDHIQQPYLSIHPCCNKYLSHWSQAVQLADVVKQFVRGALLRNGILKGGVCLQRCANILQHTCLSSNGQSGSSMWDDNQRIRAILTGKVCFLLCS